MDSGTRFSWESVSPRENNLLFSLGFASSQPRPQSFLVFQCGGGRREEQILNKIDLREVLSARETEQPLQTLVFTKIVAHKISPGSMLYCHNRTEDENILKNEKTLGTR